MEEMFGKIKKWMEEKLNSFSSNQLCRVKGMFSRKNYFDGLYITYGLFKVMLLTFLFYSFIGCNADNEPKEEMINYNIFVNKPEFSVNSAGGELSIEIECETYFYIDTQNEWISVSEYSYISSNKTKVSFYVSEYKGEDIRYGEIVIYNGKDTQKVSVCQSGASIIKLSENNINSYDLGGIYEVSFSGGNDVEIICESEWIVCELKDSCTIQIEVANLEEKTSNRAETIILHDKELDESASISVYQTHMITLSSSYLSIEEGDRKTLEYTVKLDEYRNRLVYSTSDENIANVNSYGQIYGKNPGSAIIAISTEDGLYHTYCEVRVNPFDITKHISLSIEDKVTDAEKGTHLVYCTFYNNSSKSVEITKSIIYYDGSFHSSDSSKRIVQGGSSYQVTSGRRASQMKFGFEVYYNYNGTEYRIYKDKMLDAYY